MKPLLLPINNGNNLRIYGKESDSNVVYNSTAIREYGVLEAQQIKANSIYAWTMKDDIEISSAWFVNQADSVLIPESSQITITVFSGDNPVFSLFLLFSQLVKIGSTSFMEFPPGTLIRKGNKLQIQLEDDSNGCNIIYTHCNILDSIPPIVLNVGTQPT